MGDEVYALFIVVLGLTTLGMPPAIQPAFAVLAVALAVLAHLAAQPDPMPRHEHEIHDVSEP